MTTSESLATGRCTACAPVPDTLSLSRAEWNHERRTQRSVSSVAARRPDRAWYPVTPCYWSTPSPLQPVAWSLQPTPSLYLFPLYYQFWFWSSSSPTSLSLPL